MISRENTNIFTTIGVFRKKKLQDFGKREKNKQEDWSIYLSRDMFLLGSPGLP